MDGEPTFSKLKTLLEGRGGTAVAIGIVFAVAVGLGVVLYLSSGAGEDDESAQAVATTALPGASRTSPAAQRNATATASSAGLLTPIPVSAGDTLTEADLVARGTGAAGRGAFEGHRLLVPKVGVDAPFTIKAVGEDGQMPNPEGPEDVAWYDFSMWDGLGGLPGAGGNVVLAGHVDYINYGPAVFWRLRELQVGDRIQIVMKDGTVTEYAVEFNKVVPANAENWAEIVAATGDESITLITCIGQFTAGRYTDRQVVWGRRVG